MKCIIPGPNIKVLGRAIQSLAKFGEYLYVEATENELFFRTVNSSKTAYAHYSFSSVFFSYINFDGIRQSGSGTCQISMRFALNIFKSPLTLDKTTESVQIQFQPNCDKIIFVVKYKKDVVKTFNVPVIECEVLQAHYHKDSCPNSVTIQPKIVGEILVNFQNNLDEITWKATKSNIIIKNYIEPEDVPNGIRTEICVEKDEFDNFSITNETEITFSLKELRAVLLFSDSVSLPLTANFTTFSKPIVFIIKSDIFEVNLVAATLSGVGGVISQHSYPPQECCRNLRTINNTNAKEQHPQEEQNCIGHPAENGKDKLKQVFRRCFNREMHDIRNLPGYDVVLAPDSDSEG